MSRYKIKSKYIEGWTERVSVSVYHNDREWVDREYGGYREYRVIDTKKDKIIYTSRSRVVCVHKVRQLENKAKVSKLLLKLKQSKRALSKIQKQLEFYGVDK